MTDRRATYIRLMAQAAQGDRGAAARLIDSGWFPGIAGPNDIDRVIGYAEEMGYAK